MSGDACDLFVESTRAADRARDVLRDAARAAVDREFGGALAGAREAGADLAGLAVFDDGDE